MRPAAATCSRATYTRASSTAANQFGQDVASFMLGIPTGGSVARNAQRLNTTPYHGVFVQDDWRIGAKLTLNLGLRYEYEGATSDAENRNVRGFDPTAAHCHRTPPPARPTRRARFPSFPSAAFNPQAACPVRVRRALRLLQRGHQQLPAARRACLFANDKTVLRGGWGIYTVPPIIFGNFQPGFSQTTPVVISNDNGLTFRGNLANAFVDGVIEPAGAALGANTFLGQDFSGSPRSTSTTRRTCATPSACSASCRDQWLVEGGLCGQPRLGSARRAAAARQGRSTSTACRRSICRRAASAIRPSSISWAPTSPIRSAD